VVAAAILYGGYLRTVDLAPVSLWLDDVWVAVLSRAPGLREFLLHGSSSPPLFNAIVTLCIWLLPGREVPAQIFPFICANLAIVLTALAAYLVTRRPWAAAVAALIVACHPQAIEYSTRVKQYSSDMVVAAAHVIGFCLLSDRPRVRSLWTYTLVVAGCLLLSTTSLFVVAAFFPVLMAVLLRRGVPLRHVAAATAVMTASLVLVAYGVVRPGINAALRDYWAPYYARTDSASAFLQSVQSPLAEWVARSLHGVTAKGREYWVVAAGTLVIALGAFSLLITSKQVSAGGTGSPRDRSRHEAAPATLQRRGYVLANVILLMGMLFASAAGRFPLGTGRVDLFIVPLLAIFVGAGVAYVGHAKHLAVRIPWAAAIALFLLVKFPTPRVRAYQVQFSSPLIELLGREKTTDDALLVNVHGTFALGYYSPWQPRFVADASLGTGFHVVPETTHVHVIGEQPDDPRNSVERAVTAHPPRIFFLMVHASPALREQVEGHLATAGWKLARLEQSPGADLFIFGSDRPR
jgi:flagellar biosynthesis protein FliP